MLLLLSPAFVLNATSYFSHTQVLCASFASVWCYLRSRQAPQSTGWPAAAGLALGVAAITRPVEAIELALSLVLLERLLPRRPVPRSLVVLPLAAALPVIIFMASNSAQSGSPFRTGYQALYNLGPTGFFLQGSSVIGNLWNLQFSLVRVCMWQAPLVTLGLAVGALRDRSPGRAYVISVVALALCVQAVQGGLGGVEYGSRYMLNAFGFAVILAARGLHLALRERITVRAAAVMGGFEVTFAALGVFGACLTAARATHDGVRQLDTWLAASTGPHALVFVKSAPDSYASYFTRNLPDFSGGPRRVLFLDPERNDALRRSLPDYASFLLAYDPAQGTFGLSPYPSRPADADDLNAAAVNTAVSLHKESDAAQLWRQALQRSPDRFDCAYNLMRLSYRLGDDDEALTLTRRLQQQRQDLGELWYFEARLLARRGQITDAIRAGRQALTRVAPDSSDARRWTSWVHQIEAAAETKEEPARSKP